MEHIGIDSTAEQLYAAFVTALSTGERTAADLGDGVIGLTFRDPAGTDRSIELLLTPRQLLGNAWSDHVVIDRYQGDSDELAEDPVRAGFDALVADVDEALLEAEGDETYLLLSSRQFVASTAPGRTPVPSTSGWSPAAGEGGHWTAAAPDDDGPPGDGHDLASFLAGEEALERLLAGMEPVLMPGRFVFCSVPELPPGVEPVATVREEEGLTVVITEAEADRLGLGHDYVAARVTLQVHSELEAVGLTAAVSQHLALHGLSCNIVAGFFHDHLFVPVESGARAVDLLTELSESYRPWVGDEHP